MNPAELINKMREYHRIKDPEQRFTAMLPLLSQASLDMPSAMIKYIPIYFNYAAQQGYHHWQFSLEHTALWVQTRFPALKMPNIEQTQTIIFDYIEDLLVKKDSFQYYLNISNLFLNTALALNNKEGVRQALKNLQKIAHLVEVSSLILPYQINYYQMLMNVLLYLEQPEQALACAKTTLQLIGANEQFSFSEAGIILIKIEALIKKGLIEEAWEEVTACIKKTNLLHFHRAYALYLQAMILIHKKQHSQAIELLFFALEVGKHSLPSWNKVDIYKLLADCFEYCKDYQKAFEYYKLINNLQQEHKEQTSGWLYKFWYKMLEKYSISEGVTDTVWDNWSQVQQSLPPNEQQFIQKLFEILQKQIGQKNYGVQELAFDMDISERQLARKINQYFELSPLQLIRKIKIDLSKQMLSQKMWTVQEIADYLGFSSASYFIKSFKEATGSTPAEYQP